MGSEQAQQVLKRLDRDMKKLDKILKKNPDVNDPIEIAEAANGPKLAAWLKRYLELTGGRTQHGDALERAVSRWVAGAQPTLYVVDRFMNQLGFGLYELPDEVWEFAAPRKIGEGATTLPPRKCQGCGGNIPYRRVDGKLRSKSEYQSALWCSVKCRVKRDLGTCQRDGCDDKVKEGATMYCSRRCQNLSRQGQGQKPSNRLFAQHTGGPFEDGRRRLVEAWREDEDDSEGMRGSRVA